jgi:hypothetical protein
VELQQPVPFARSDRLDTVDEFPGLVVNRHEALVVELAEWHFQEVPASFAASQAVERQ